MTRPLRVFPLALLLLIVSLGSAANERPKPDRSPRAGTAIAVVTGIVDGDSLYLNIDGRATRVRLAQIDAPEKKMPFGRRSEQSLRELVWKREVTATWRELDRYGRPVAQIIVDGIDVNAAQVERGMAWVYIRYATDPRLRELKPTHAARSAACGSILTRSHPGSGAKRKRSDALREACAARLISAL